MRGLPQKQNARRADKIRLCGHLGRYKKIVKKTYIIYNKLLDFEIPCEYHLFGHGEHGKSLENQLTHIKDNEIDLHLNQWVKLAKQWMERIGSE